MSLASIWSIFLRLSRGHRSATRPKVVPNTTAQHNDHSIKQRTRTVRFVFTIGTAERKGSNEASVYVGPAMEGSTKNDLPWLLANVLACFLIDSATLPGSSFLYSTIVHVMMCLKKF